MMRASRKPLTVAPTYAQTLSSKLTHYRRAWRIALKKPVCFRQADWPLAAVAVSPGPSAIGVDHHEKASGAEHRTVTLVRDGAGPGAGRGVTSSPALSVDVSGERRPLSIGKSRLETEGTEVIASPCEPVFAQTIAPPRISTRRVTQDIMIWRVRVCGQSERA
jgi:hypothetical protein